MAQLKPENSQELLELQNLRCLLRCILCKAVPNPDAYYLCGACERVICGSCALSQPKINGTNNNDKDITERDCCSAPTNLKKGPSMFLRNLLEQTQWECDHRRNGCKMKVNGVELAKHVMHCRYRFSHVDCHIANCSGVGMTLPNQAVDGIVNHYQTKHSLVEIPMEGSKVDLEMRFHRSYLGTDASLLRDGKEFFLLATRSCKLKELIHIWVWSTTDALTSSSAATGAATMQPTSKKKFRLTIASPDETVGGMGVLGYRGTCIRILHSYTAFVHSCDAEDVIREGNCLTVTWSQLEKKLLDEENNWKLAVFILDE